MRLWGKLASQYAHEQIVVPPARDRHGFALATFEHEAARQVTPDRAGVVGGNSKSDPVQPWLAKRMM